MKDSQIKGYIGEEKKRQFEGIELIASENYVSEDVLECLGSILTNKYSEGYPSKRYYSGNQIIDKIETEAIERAKSLFHVKYVNVQPYSGSPANLAIYFALLKPGDKTMGMSLDAGGHLTHGFKASFSGKYFDSVNYGVNDDGYIDYENARKIALEHKPKLIFAGFSAYSRIVDWKKMREIADEVGAYLVVDIAHVAGLIAAGLYPSPVEYADIITTTTHKTLRGPRAGMIMTNNEEISEMVDKAIFPGLQGGPHENVIAAISVALKEASTEEFKEYSKQVISNAQCLAGEMEKLGYKIISGGTDNHLFLVDMVSSINMGGKDVSNILESVNITLNKNAIPNDTRKPWDPSGVRIGTAAITTRGMKEKEMKQIAQFIDNILRNPSEENIQKIRKEVKAFTEPFSIPGIDKM